jgi:type IV secretory pathway TrbL component
MMSDIPKVILFHAGTKKALNFLAEGFLFNLVSLFQDLTLKALITSTTKNFIVPILYFFES